MKRAERLLLHSNSILNPFEGCGFRKRLNVVRLPEVTPEVFLVIKSIQSATFQLVPGRYQAYATSCVVARSALSGRLCQVGRPNRILEQPQDYGITKSPEYFHVVNSNFKLRRTWTRCNENNKRWDTATPKEERDLATWQRFHSFHSSSATRKKRGGKYRVRI
jgi:hypothetical protein